MLLQAHMGTHQVGVMLMMIPMIPRRARSEGRANMWKGRVL